MTAPTPDNVIDFHRIVSIEFLKSSSGFAVRTPRGQKDPGSIQWDPKTNNREKSKQIISLLESNNDNLGVHLFGPVVDVDIDSDNPFLQQALDYFLPPTAHIWGRPSRPRTHRLYELSGANAAFDPAEFAFLSKIQSYNDGEIALEVRGGEVHSGRYSLLPGSMHPSGEFYQWDSTKAARSTPTQVPLFRLMDGVRLAAVAAIIAPYWVEGVRNEMCKALCGFMYRAASYNEELNAEMPFDKEAAAKLLEGILVISDDDEADKSMRWRTFDQTWEKGAAGQPVTGATKLVSLTGKPEILPMLYALLANTPELQQLDELFSQYVVVRNTTTLLDLNLGARGNYAMSREAFFFTLGGRYLTTPKGRVPLSTVYVNSMQRTIVDTISIDPDQPKIYTNTEGLRCANIWSGWNIQPFEGDVSEADVAPFLGYVHDVLARGEKGLAEWIITWLADIFQNPARKSGTALILVGEQGAGKTFLGAKVLRPIIGNAHYIKASTSEKLMSKFNSHMSGKLVIQGEEVLNSNRRVDAEAIKDMITSDRRTIEPKGRDVFEMEDHARYILTSNNEDNAIAVGKGDRRNTIAHVSSKYAYMDGKNLERQREFWPRMHAYVEDTDEKGRDIPHVENLSKLHKYLATVNVDRALIRDAYETEIKRRTRVTSARGLDSWLMSMIELNNPFEYMREADKGEGHSWNKDGHKFKPTTDWPEFVKYGLLEMSLRMFASRDHAEQKSAQQIARYFKDAGMLSHTEDVQFRYGGEKIRVRPFPKREAIRKYLLDAGYSILETNEVNDEGEQDDGPVKF